MNHVPWTVVATAATALAVLGLLSWAIVRQWRRYRAAPRQVLRRISVAQLSDVLIPDDVDGEIHLDHVLLTPKGILVLELRNVAGAVFGSDSMSDWTVLSGYRRYTFRNPLGAMVARVHAVRRLAGQVPVTGRVVLVGDVELPAGDIPGTVTLQALEEEFGPVEGEQDRDATAPFRAFWDRISREAKPHAA